MLTILNFHKNEKKTSTLHNLQYKIRERCINKFKKMN